MKVNKNKSYLQGLLSVAVLSTTLLCLISFDLYAREMTSPAIDPIVKTRAVGEGGNVDAFLNDVVPGWPGWSRRERLPGHIGGGPRMGPWISMGIKIRFLRLRR